MIGRGGEGLEKKRKRGREKEKWARKPVQGTAIVVLSYFLVEDGNAGVVCAVMDGGQAHGQARGQAGREGLHV